jgi:hypothetical protein
MGEPVKVSVLLDGGVIERQTSELRGPVAQQGASINLVESTNTRLTVEPGTCRRAPLLIEQATHASGEVDCHGVVPAEYGRRSVYFYPPSNGSAIRASTGTTSGQGDGRLLSINTFTGGAVDEQQNAYLPTQIVDSGAVSGVAASSEVAVVYAGGATDEIWYAWTSTSRTEPDEIEVWVACYESTGKMLASATKLETTLVQAEWVGLTAHPVTNGGVRLWYLDRVGEGDDALMMRHLYVNGTLAGADAAIEVYQPSDVEVGCDVVSQGDLFAYVTTCSSANVTDAVCLKVSVDTGAVSATATMVDSLDYGGVDPVHGSTSLAHAVVGGVNRIAFIASRGENAATAPSVSYTMLDDTMTSVWFATKTFVGGFTYYVAVKFLIVAELSLSHAVFVFSDRIGSGLSTTGRATNLLAEPVGGGSTVTMEPLSWKMIQSHGFHYRKGNDMYPVFPMFTTFVAPSVILAQPDIADAVLDPSIEAMLVGSLVNVTPVGRFGVVRFSLSPALVKGIVPLAGGVSGDVDGDYVVPYRKLHFGAQTGYEYDYATRFVKLSFAPWQPSVAHDKDGVSLVAAALPVQWDGAEAVEIGAPLHMPVVSAASSSSGDVLPPGTYQVRAVYQWTDSAGLVHRSQPSTAEDVEIVAASGFENITVRVATPDSMRNGVTQYLVDALLYVTVANGLTYHLSPNRPTTVDDGLYDFEFIDEPTESAPQLYSTGTAGEEVVPQPPPPLWDIAIVGSRCWGIDAEVRSRLVYSKYRIAGIGFEFAPAFEVMFPSGAGKLVAIREFQGVLIAFAERAVFQVAGEGPSNNLGSNSQGFGQPVKISDVGCRSRESVISTPTGIIYQTAENMFALLSGGGSTVMPQMGADFTVSGSIRLNDADEVVFFDADSAVARVYNYAAQRWTRWTLPDDMRVVGAVESAIDQNSAFILATTDEQPVVSTWIVHSDTPNPEAMMQWETDWVILGGDFQDCVTLRDVLFNGYRVGLHGVRVELFTNYEATATTSRDWTNAELAAIANPIGRFTVRVEPVRQDTRAVKIRITELINGAGDADGMKPGALTLVYSVDGQLHEEAVNIPNSYK